jgi:hypothetical protein
LSTFVSNHDFVKAFCGFDPIPWPAKADRFRHSCGRARPASNHPACSVKPKSRLDVALQLFRRFPIGAFLAVFLLVFRAVVLAALLDRPAAVFLAGFATDFLTAFFARVFLRGLTARLAAARFRGGA